ncbi:hypothetical protein BP6252_09882 [Coleophoma cylindrospora]|uniref:VPS37 C-terminal domain-containing protein n=1 Tax=Coleophoma cylindrospora TaxID=1849047 RepID=A0A3D8QWV3_9HELO|nr:hypothetical protein BP6252_09882 [Coleophoma cylindrospora]
MASPASSPLPYPPYNPQRLSQSFDPNAPPAPPPKPSSRDISRKATPAAGQTLPPPPADQTASHPGDRNDPQSLQQARLREAAQAPVIQDPGEQWLPSALEDKSKQDLQNILARPELLAALAHAEATAHPSTASSQEPLHAALTENMALATHLTDFEARLTHLRASTQTQLLTAHALERQWKSKQADMDRALAPFSPSSLYQRLGQGVQEQEMMCRTLEESFLEGDGGVASEREASEWVRRYREQKKTYYLRREHKERWDEGRVGGWR